MKRKREDSGEPLDTAVATRSLELFSYTALTSPKQEIRLLESFPSSSEHSPESIECHMRHATLSDHVYRFIPFTYPQPDNTNCFAALSYTWGPAVQRACQKSIILNGHPFNVRDNLFDFLQSQCTSARSSYLWIDAICINQDDLAEKSHQVALMSTIFKSAKIVCVWLGKGHPEIDTAFKILSTNSYRPTTRLDPSGFLVRDNEPHIFRYTREGDLMLQKGMRAILKLPYWSRIWVVQEVLLARDICLLYDKHIIEWREFRSAYDRLEVEHRGPDDLSSPEPLFRTEHGHNRFNLRDLMWRFCQRQCENPLDHIYALVGMATDWFVGHKLLRVDYSISTDRLLARVIECLDTYDWALIRHLIRCLNPCVNDCNPWKDFPLAKKKARDIHKRKVDERMERARSPDVYGTESETTDEASGSTL